MSENRNLSTKILQMYEELKTMKEIVLGLTSPHNIVTAEEKDKLRQSLLTTDWKFLPGIKDERYNKFYLLSTADEDVTSLGQELLDELDEALNLFDISNIQNNALPETKQVVLATLYLVGVRDIVIQNNNFAFWMVEGFFGPYSGRGFGGTFPYLSKDFSLKEFTELWEKSNSDFLSLHDLIKEFCPKYQYVLNYDPNEED